MSHVFDEFVTVMWGLVALVVIILFLFIISASCYEYGKTEGYKDGYKDGYKGGYTQALDDIRLGKPSKYKLVQTAEKWVEVKR